MKEIIASEQKETIQYALTRREKEILVLIRQGLTDEEIGELLGRSPGTIGTHCIKIKRKLGLKGSRKNLFKYSVGQFTV